MTTTELNLDHLMEFGHVIRVHDDGTVTEPRDVWAPDIYAMSDEDGSHLPDTDADLQDQARRQGWTLKTGWTGQDRYHGPCMHSSEYVGGGLAQHILETPGLWVVVVVGEEDMDDVDSWAIAYRDA